MPLRALLLPPEQPSTSGFGENNGAYNTLKLSVSTPAPSPRSSHARLDGYDYLAEANASANFEAQRGTSWSNVYVSVLILRSMIIECSDPGFAGMNTLHRLTL
jgi:hypothetical protein